MTASAALVLRAAELKATTLTAETRGYLVLAAAEAVRGRPSTFSLADITVTENGAVKVAAGLASDDETAAACLTELLQQALRGAATSPGALTQVRAVPARSIDELVRRLEAALVPLNRSAAQRVLGRAARLAAQVALPDEVATGADAQSEPKVRLRVTAAPVTFESDDLLPTAEPRAPHPVRVPALRSEADEIESEEPMKKGAPEPVRSVPDPVRAGTEPDAVRLAVPPKPETTVPSAEHIEHSARAEQAGRAEPADPSGAPKTQPKTQPSALAPLVAERAVTPMGDGAAEKGAEAPADAAEPKEPSPAGQAPSGPTKAAPRRARVSALKELMARFHVSEAAFALRFKDAEALRDDEPSHAQGESDGTESGPLLWDTQRIALLTGTPPVVYRSETPPPAVPEPEASEPGVAGGRIRPAPVIAITLGGVGVFALVVALGAQVGGSATAGARGESYVAASRSGEEPPASARAAAPASERVAAPACKATIEVEGAPEGAELTLVPHAGAGFEARKAIGPLARFSGLPCGVQANLMVRAQANADSWLRLDVSARETTPAEPGVSEVTTRLRVPSAGARSGPKRDPEGGTAR